MANDHIADDRKKVRLIDANALDEKLEMFKLRFKAQGRDRVANDYNFVQTVLSTALTVDAAPVVHGRWDMATDGDGVVCSVCGTDFCILLNETDGFKYCPNCGAKMDGGDGR